MEKIYFICQQWFAVEKDDGKIERTLSVANKLQKLEFSYLLSKNIYPNFADNHLWFSIFSYHPLSLNFTRIQRCTCCFVFLFLNLLMSIIYYDIHETNTIENFLTIGPFYFTQEQACYLYISILNLINNHKILISICIKNQKSKLLFPWWCLIIVYMISSLFIGIFIIFILNRSIYIGDIKTRIWLASILISFMSSIFLTQPLKVFGLTLFCMCICRNKHSNDFDFDDDHLISLTCQKYVSNTNEHIQRRVSSFIPINRFSLIRTKWKEMNLEEARHKQLIEIQTWTIIREIQILVLFLVCLYSITYANHDIENSHVMSQTFSTEYNTYFGGGYNYQLRGSLLEIIGDLSELENTSWFDRNT
ncbi:unnamed protein product [Rotaria sp. Silwood1]|nr:unnamed protein product [Rotaria sp. Silwood1]